MIVSILALAFSLGAIALAVWRINRADRQRRSCWSRKDDQQ